MQEKIHFKPKVDLALILVPILFCLPTIFITMMSKDYTSSAVFAIIFLLFTLALISFFYSFKYYIDSESQTLVVKYMFGRKRIAIKNITALSKSSSMMAAPAPSLDRVEIKVARQSSGVLISVKNKKEFVSTLLKYNDNIKVKFKY